MSLLFIVEDEFLIIGCDGLFDVVTAADAAVSVEAALKSTEDPYAAAQQLVELALINHSEGTLLRTDLGR